MSTVAFLHSQQPANPCKAGDSERDHMARIAHRAAELVRAHGHTVHVSPIEDSTRDGKVNYADNVLWLNSLHKKTPVEFGVSFHSNALGGSLVAYPPGNQKGRLLALAIKNRLDPVVPDTCGVRDNLLVSEIVKTKTPVVLTESYRHDTVDGARFIHENIEQIAQAHADAVLDIVGRAADPLVQTKPLEPAPAPEPAVEPKLRVDGVFGPATIKRFQKVIGAKADGIWGGDSKRAAQRWLGVQVDGLFWSGSISALQKKVGSKVDGIWGPNTTKALQTYLND